jgi:hypothetical protein
VLDDRVHELDDQRELVAQLGLDVALERLGVLAADDDLTT